MDRNALAIRIRDAGFRATKPRLLLLSHLYKSKSPQSIAEIAAALKTSVNQVTVYRIVDTFKKAGLVRELDLRQGRPRYELADLNHHHHVICVKCGRIEKFTGCESKRITQKALTQTKGFGQITSHSLEFFGLCNSCIKRGHHIPVS